MQNYQSGEMSRKGGMQDPHLRTLRVLILELPKQIIQRDKEIGEIFGKPINKKGTDDLYMPLWSHSGSPRAQADSTDTEINLGETGGNIGGDIGDYTGDIDDSSGDIGDTGGNIGGDIRDYTGDIGDIGGTGSDIGNYNGDIVDNGDNNADNNGGMADDGDIDNNGDTDTNMGYNDYGESQVEGSENGQRGVYN
ncbi:circumsporozoite protein-like [Macrobrachium nipponense]|uniref:circumsporozoite protein-like n=1 Tax=Macrobrachium nipponense TaxID=159736 RepID=UPI0030C7FCE9